MSECNLSLQRAPNSLACALGVLSVPSLSYPIYTLEDVVREVDGAPVESWKVQNRTAIPAGRYRVILDRSERFSKAESARLGRAVDVVMPHLLDVPGFDGVRIHWGNTEVDTDGCILVGMATSANNFLSRSREAYGLLLPQLHDADAGGAEIWIDVLNAA